MVLASPWSCITSDWFRGRDPLTIFMRLVSSSQDYPSIFMYCRVWTEIMEPMLQLFCYVCNSIYLLARLWSKSEQVAAFLPWVLNRQGGCLACWRLQDRFPAEAALIYTKHEVLRWYCLWGLGVLPVNWIHRLWRHCPYRSWSTATKSSPLGYFSRSL